MLQKITWRLLLHDIRSVQNVASIFRLAECLGCKEIIISGNTPGPLDRFQRPRSDFEKISLNSHHDVLWIRIGKEASNALYTAEVDEFNMQIVLEFLEREKKNKFQKIIAIEQDEAALDYKKVAERIKLNFIKSAEGGEMSLEYLVILGREVEGVDPKILGFADFIAEIPQYGKKESLNVFSAASVALYRFFDL